MATNNYMPMGRNPRNPAGQNAGYKKGGTTKIAGVMKGGGVTKYQKKSTVTTKPLMSPAKIAVPGTSRPATPADRAKFMDMLKKGTTPTPKGKAKSGGSMKGKK
jgi:hypothetical protein